MGKIKFGAGEDPAKAAVDEARELMEGVRSTGWNIPPGDALMAVIAGELKRINDHLERLVSAKGGV